MICNACLYMCLTSTAVLFFFFSFFFCPFVFSAFCLAGVTLRKIEETEGTVLDIYVEKLYIEERENSLTLQ